MLMSMIMFGFFCGILPSWQLINECRPILLHLLICEQACIQSRFDVCLVK